MQWSQTGDQSLDFVKSLIYGASGVGKTRLALTAPKPLIISAENGLLSLRKARIPVIKIESIDDLYQAYNWCYGNKLAYQFNTIFIDSITEVAETVLKNEKKLTKDPRKAYGALIDQMIPAIKAFRDLPYRHVVMIAKMSLEKDAMTGAIKWSPSMPGNKIGPELPYLFDEVFRIGQTTTPQGEKQSFIQTSADLQFDAKDRSGSLAPVEPPDLTYIFNKILRS